MLVVTQPWTIWPRSTRSFPQQSKNPRQCEFPIKFVGSALEADFLHKYHSSYFCILSFSSYQHARCNVNIENRTSPHSEFPTTIQDVKNIWNSNTIRLCIRIVFLKLSLVLRSRNLKSTPLLCKSSRLERFKLQLWLAAPSLCTNNKLRLGAAMHFLTISSFFVFSYTVDAATKCSEMKKMYQDAGCSSFRI